LVAASPSKTLLNEKFYFIFISASVFSATVSAQDNSSSEIITGVEPQPLLAQTLRLDDALSFLGSALSKEDAKELKALRNTTLTGETSKCIQDILDPYCLALVDINPEARVKVERGAANAKLIQGGWTTFLIKVHNEAGITAQLQVQSENAKPDLHISTFNARAGNSAWSASYKCLIEKLMLKIITNVR
jgi:hypothetical protein